MNKYLKVGENVKLSDDATRRICESMRAANRELAAEKAKKRRLWSCRAFKLAVVCASAALVCGAAIGTGIYFGVNERDKSDKSDYSVYYTPKYFCYTMGYKMDKFVQDINNFELDLYYAFDEQEMRGRYNEVLEEAKEKGYGEVLKYEILLSINNGNYYGEYSYFGIDRVILKAFQIMDIDEFPFNDYTIAYTEENGVVTNVEFAHSEKIIVPSELFVDCKAKWNQIKWTERIEYEIGYADFEPQQTLDGQNYPNGSEYWSNGGKVANSNFGLGGFLPYNYYTNTFFYELKNDKVIIDEEQFKEDDYSGGFSGFIRDGVLNRFVLDRRFKYMGENDYHTSDACFC